MQRTELMRVSLAVVACAAVLGGLLSLGLDVLAGHKAYSPQPALYAWVSAVTAALAPLVLLFRTQRRLSRPGAAEVLGNLPGRLMLRFCAGGLAGLLVGAAVFSRSLRVAHPSAVLLAGPAMVLALAMVVRSLIRRPLLRQTLRLHTEQPTSVPSPHVAVDVSPHRRGVPAIRSEVLATVLVVGVVAASLLGVHGYSAIRNQQQRWAYASLRPLLGAVTEQLKRAHDPRQLLALLPAEPLGIPLLVNAEGRVVAASAARFVGQRLDQLGAGYCRLVRRWRCLAGRRFAAGRLVMVQDPEVWLMIPGLGSLRVEIVLVSAILVALVGLLAWAVGSDISRRLAGVHAQLQGMSRQESLDLSRTICVSSLDETGQLVVAVDALYRQLDHDLRTYHQSLEKARQAEAFKDRFTRDVRHELRTPLDRLSEQTTKLVAGEYGKLTIDQSNDVQIISKASQQLGELIDDVLDITAMQSGKLRLALQWVDLAAMCRETLAQYQAVVRKAAGPRGSAVTLVGEIANDLPTLWADGRRIRQVIQNLLSNAIKFTPQGRICLRARRENQLVVIEVIDSGVGIGSADLARVFAEYRQAGTHQSKRKGSGLGLTICKRLVDLHGGQIEAESDVGRGSVFRVILPLEAPVPTEADDG